MSESKWQESVPKVEKIEKLDPHQKATPVEMGQEVADLNQAKFHKALAVADPASQPTIIERGRARLDIDSDSATTNPIDELGKVSSSQKTQKEPKIEDVINQAEDLRKGLEEPINNIQGFENALKKNNKTLEDVPFPTGKEAILTDKLIHIDSSLRTSLSTAGVEVKAQDIAQAGQKPLTKFLGYLTHSDQQMGILISELNGMQAKNKRLNQGKLLALQIKIGFVQNEIEFFTNVLNKSLESIKTIMNVQV